MFEKNFHYGQGKDFAGAESAQSSHGAKDKKGAYNDKHAGEMSEIVFILDRSGSMGGLEDETIGGYNATLEDQRKLPGRGRVTTVLFDDKIDVIEHRVDLSSAKPLTRKQYQVRGCTALLDALGQTIREINKQQKADPAGRPDHTIFVITTDGMENSSHEYTLEKVRKMIDKRKKKNGWEFIFLGANIDAVKTAGSLGISADRAATYVADGLGTECMYAAASCALGNLRQHAKMGAEWKADVEKDTATRG